MALVAHRMMLPARHRRSTTQQVARNKVGVLLVPSVADYYGAEVAPGLATPLPTPAASQLHLPQDAAEASGDGSATKVSATSRCNDPHSIDCVGMRGFSSGDFPQNSSFAFSKDFEPAAYVEVRNGSRLSQSPEKSPGGRENEIIRSAAKEHEREMRQRYVENPSSDRGQKLKHKTEYD
ncbi:uncharacterized protein LOC120444055 [Drosophila santomea]|uniref:uncharacterized protein LOC120444055 n=1 Tax=Drosophila santomea TaxID=129105 RepID=UPI001953323A|nr:uncharacterized protein LOC120444055 [Drosophila santomea]